MIEKMSKKKIKKYIWMINHNTPYTFSRRSVKVMYLINKRFAVFVAYGEVQTMNILGDVAPARLTKEIFDVLSMLLDEFGVLYFSSSDPKRIKNYKSRFFSKVFDVEILEERKSYARVKLTNKGTKNKTKPTSIN